MLSKLFFVLIALCHCQFASSTVQLLSAMPQSHANSNCSERLMKMLNRFVSDDAIFSAFFYGGKGINDLGNYDVCRKDPHNRYILLELTGLPGSVAVGLCGPAECRDVDYSKTKKLLVNTINSIFSEKKGTPLSHNFTESEIDFIDPVSVAEEKAKVTWYFYASISYLLLMFLISFVCLCLTGITMKGTFGKIVACFDLAKNFTAIFDTSRSEDPDLKVLNGVRVISMLWVILGHTFYYAKIGYVSNVFEILDFMTQFRYSYILSAPFSVDIFFFLSAFLAAYMLTRQLVADGGKLPFGAIYIGRVMRIYPMYLITVLIFCFVFPLAGQGPGFHNYYKEVENNCGNNWWKNILFINNFTRYGEECLPHTWYVANEMQFFFLTPIFVLLYYKSRMLGYASLILLGTACSILGIVLCFMYDLSASYMEFNGDYFELYYRRPYNRITPYLIGLALGFLYYEYKSGKTENFLTKLTKKVQSSILVRITMYAVSLIGMFWLICAIYWLNNYPKDWKGWPDALYLILSKPLFVILLFFLLYPAMVDRARLVQAFLGSPMFVPLARVTFGAYMIHPIIMTFMSYSQRKEDFFEYSLMLIRFGGYAVISYLLSFFLTAIFESPVIGLDKEFIRPRKRAAIAKPTPKDKNTESLMLNEGKEN